MAGDKKTGDKMTKADLVAFISDETGLQKQKVEDVFESLYTVMEQQLGSDGPGEFTIPGVVKLRTVEKAATKAREGRNPATGETITIPAKPAHRVVKASVLKVVRDLV